MKIGFVVAMESEYEPFLSRLGTLEKSELLTGIEFSIYNSFENSVILAKCGIGTVAASAATALLIGHYGCDYIANFGLVGSLSDFSLGALVAVSDVVHYDADLTPFGHPLGAAYDMPSPYIPADPATLAALERKGLSAARIACGDKFIADESLKSRLYSDFSAKICDMESSGIALVCARSHIPFMMIKLVSDGAGEGAAVTFAASKSKAFDFAIDLVLDTLHDF